MRQAQDQTGGSDADLGRIATHPEEPLAARTFAMRVGALR
jgi:hypothetical protein